MAKKKTKKNYTLSEMKDMVWAFVTAHGVDTDGTYNDEAKKLQIVLDTYAKSAKYSLPPIDLSGEEYARLAQEVEDSCLDATTKNKLRAAFKAAHE